MYFYNVFLQRHFTYVNLHMVCIFTTLFYMWYVFLQRIFTYGMYFYNAFLHMVCIFTTVFVCGITSKFPHSQYTYVF